MDKLEVFEKAVELLEVSGYDASLNRTYSGRGMYGDTTPAISTDSSPVHIGWAITCAVIELGGEAEDAEEFLPRCSDSLGLGTVHY